MSDYFCDESAAVFTGHWQVSSYAGRYGPTYRYATCAPAPTKTCTFKIESLPAGKYKVYTTYRIKPSRSPDAPFEVFDGSTSLGVYRIDQRVAPADATVGGVAWKLLGTFEIDSGTLRVRLTNEAAGVYINADGIYAATETVAPPSTPVDPIQTRWVVPQLITQGTQSSTAVCRDFAATQAAAYAFLKFRRDRGESPVPDSCRFSPGFHVALEYGAGGTVLPNGAGVSGGQFIGYVPLSEFPTYSQNPAALAKLITWANLVSAFVHSDVGSNIPPFATMDSPTYGHAVQVFDPEATATLWKARFAAGYAIDLDDPPPLFSSTEGHATVGVGFEEVGGVRYMLYQNSWGEGLRLLRMPWPIVGSWTAPNGHTSTWATPYYVQGVSVTMNSLLSVATATASAHAWWRALPADQKARMPAVIEP